MKEEISKAESVLETMFKESMLAETSEIDRMMKYEQDVINQSIEWLHSRPKISLEENLKNTVSMMTQIFEELHNVQHGFIFSEENMRQMSLEANWPEELIMVFFDMKLKQQKSDEQRRFDDILVWKDSLERMNAIEKAYMDCMSGELMTEEEMKMKMEEMMEQIFQKLKNTRNGLKFDKDITRAIGLLTAWSTDKVSDWFEKRKEGEEARVVDNVDFEESMSAEVPGEKAFDNDGGRAEDTRERMDNPEMDWGDNDGMEYEEERKEKRRYERIMEWMESVDRTEVIKNAYVDWMSDEMMADEKMKINTEKMMEHIFRKLRKIGNGLKFDKDNNEAMELLTAWSKDEVSEWFEKRKEEEAARVADGIDDFEEPMAAEIPDENTFGEVGVQTEDLRERRDYPEMDWGDNDEMDYEEDAEGSEGIEDDDEIGDSEKSDNEDDEIRVKSVLRKRDRESDKNQVDSDEEEEEEEVATYRKPSNRTQTSNVLYHTRRRNKKSTNSRKESDDEESAEEDDKDEEEEEEEEEVTTRPSTSRRTRTRTVLYQAASVNKKSSKGQAGFSGSMGPSISNGNVQKCGRQRGKGNNVLFPKTAKVEQGTMIKCCFPNCGSNYNKKFSVKKGIQPFLFHSLIHTSEFGAFFNCRRCDKKTTTLGMLKWHLNKKHEIVRVTGYNTRELLERFPNFKQHFKKCFGNQLEL